MLENNQTNSNSQALPFFARYLEGQSMEDLLTEEMETVKGGYKFPFGGAITLKYPSDNDDQLPPGGAMTLKYPSDSDDQFPPGGAITLKYPSDSDDQLPAWSLQK